MRRTAVTPENKVETYEAFPKLKLDKGEKALVSFHEDPGVTYVHNLRRPKVVNGVAQMEVITPKKGEPFEANVMDFVSRPLCLGEQEILEERGVDVKNCPACAAAKAGDTRKSVDMPQLRYAFHGFKYNTKAGSYDLQLPFGGTVVVWSFTVKIYNKLIEMVKEYQSDVDDDGNLIHPEAGLKDFDVKFECISKDFQSYELQAARSALWKKNKAQTEHVLTALEENQAKDLEAICGKSMTREAIEEDLESIQESWKMADGVADEVTDADKANMNAALMGIVNKTKVVEDEAPVQVEESPTMDMAELLAKVQKS